MSATIPISKTKILAPHRRSELLSRARLLGEINASLDRKLILLSAPAGYGKTSLMVDVAAGTKLPVCWLSLDPLDRNPQRFISYLVAALAERFPGIQAPIRPLLSSLKSIEEDAEPLLVTLTNELYDQVEEDFLFFIDDFHIMDGLPTIASILNRFLQLVDDNCHMILATRTLPDLPDLMLMIAREQTEGLNQTDLAFRPQEIQALFNQNHGQLLPDQTALQLFEQSNGWITGIILSDLSGIPRISRTDTFTYLGRQVLDQQPKEMRDFLLRTCLPDEFNVELCEVVLAPLQRKRLNWNALMGQLLEKNLFALRVGTDGGWVRYHPLFREFLQARLAEERPDEIDSILDRLTHFYEQSGEWEKAYFTCQQLNDPELLAAVVERAGTPMLQHAFTTLEDWVQSLPPALAYSRPGLISLRGGIALIRGNPRDAIELLNSAEEIYRKEENTEGLALVLTRRASAYRLLGKYEVSLRHAEEVMRLTESKRELQATYAEALRIKGASLYRLGHSREAIDYLEHSLSLFRALKESGSIPLLLVETGVVYIAVGEKEAARSAFHKALKIWQEEKNLSLQADVLNNIAILHHQAGEYELAAEALEAGLSMARRSRYSKAEALILTSLGDLYSEVGDYGSARQAYEKAQPIANLWPGSFIDTYLILARASLAVLEGNVSLATFILENGRRSLQANSSLYERGLMLLIEGRIHLLAKQPDRAITAFKECRDYFQQDGREMEILWGQIWLIAALGEAGEIESARSQALEFISQRKASSHPMLIALGQAAPWIRLLRNDPELGRSLNSLLEKARRLLEKMPAVRRSLRHLAQSIEMPTASLVIHAFGRGEVQVDGRVVTSSDWKNQSVRDLFFYFLCKGIAVTKEQIAADLWPEEEDPQILKQRFKTYIFRLRRATRRDVIIFDEEYYRFNYALDYEYDVEAFETYLARARAAREPQERIEHYRRAEHLVKGPYLADLTMPWALGERDRLEEAFLAALTDLAQLYLSAGQLQDAASAAHRILEWDPYREEIHQLSMKTYSALKDRRAIHRQYEACKSALAVLGLLPSPQTERLYRELTG